MAKGCADRDARATVTRKTSSRTIERPPTVRDRLELSAPRRLIAPSAARTVLVALLGRIRGGTVRVDEGSRTTTYGDDQGLQGQIDVRDPTAWSLIVQRGSVGLGESYIDGLVETRDLVSVLRVLVRNVDRLNAHLNRISVVTSALVDWLDRRRRRAKLMVQSDVRAHYDVGDDFFELFLDPTMTYSSALFAAHDATLEDAQRAKLERICEKLALSPSDHVVEIGSGWGSFAIHAASTRGCRVTTTTISANQFAATTARVAAAGLDHLVDVRQLDYRDVSGTFTKLVSIEMIEAVDWRDYDEYFGAINRLLAPGGIAVIQAILIGDGDFERAKRRDDFIKTYVFPGGCLPSLRAIRTSLDRSTLLQVTDQEQFGAHYVRTLQEWRQRLNDRRHEAMQLGYGPRFLRLWDFYLSYCEAAFAEGHVTVAQLVLSQRPETHSTPDARSSHTVHTRGLGPASSTKPVPGP